MRTRMVSSGMILILCVLVFHAFSPSDKRGIRAGNADIVVKGLTNFFDVSKSNPDIVYALTGGELKKSVDAGKSWTEIKSISKIVTVKVDPNNPDIVYAAQGG